MTATGDYLTLKAISIHALRKEGDELVALVPVERLEISIHALRKEGDYLRPQCECGRVYFYPRPPQGGRHAIWRAAGGGLDISIHALRKEGDLARSPPFASVTEFLSTPSARRATCGRITYDPHTTISIHALRKEGDSKNGEKHLRFCFIIKRSAQIWKSLSKNIRKNS